MVERGMMYRGMVNRGMMNRGMMNRGVMRGPGRIGSGSFVSHIGNVAVVVVGSVRHNLYAAIGQGDSVPKIGMQVSFQELPSSAFAKNLLTLKSTK